ncbi:MAG TPA: ethanolamine ammonia-lyase subunit EutC [Burkholderiaceae bacterium]
MSEDELPAEEGALWDTLRKLTTARIGLGRSGVSLPTRAHLEFQFAHARARDAVHLPFDRAALAAQLNEQGLPSLYLSSAAGERQRYLQRPDLGRKLHPDSIRSLQAHRATHPAPVDLAVVVADGLSALAVQRHALPFLQQLHTHLTLVGWTLAPVCLVEQGRVALGDEIGVLLGARMLVMLIGERPGLSSPDSMGLYFTYAPAPGLSDVNRNCISNVRVEGLSYAIAAHRLMYLMHEARRRRLSGVALKDDSDMQRVGDTDVA